MPFPQGSILLDCFFTCLLSLIILTLDPFYLNSLVLLV